MKRLFSLLLCAVLLVFMMPQIIFAEEGIVDNDVSEQEGNSNLCEHHIEHDESCGYNDAEGSSCSYVCQICKLDKDGTQLEVQDSQESEDLQESGNLQESEDVSEVQELQTFNAVTRSVPKETLESHIVTDRVSNPEGVVVNLFDYWVNDSGEFPIGSTTPKGDLLTKDHQHVREKPSAWGNTAAYSSANDWWHGINENHLLIFGDGVIHAGLWNKGAGENTDYGKQYAGMEGIVNPVLINGYPTIRLEAARQQLINDETERNWKLIGDCMLTGDHVDNLASPGVYTYESKDIQNLSNTLIQKWENDGYCKEYPILVCVRILQNFRKVKSVD